MQNHYFSENKIALMVAAFVILEYFSLFCVYMCDTYAVRVSHTSSMHIG